MASLSSLLFVKNAQGTGALKGLKFGSDQLKQNG